MRLGVDLEAIVPVQGRNLTDITYDLIRVCAAQDGGLSELMIAARYAVPENGELSYVVESLGQIHFAVLPLPDNLQKHVQANHGGIAAGRDIVGNTILNGGGNVIYQIMVSQPIEQADTDQWKIAAEKYEKNLRSQHATIRILGKPEPIPLEGIYTDIFMLDKPAALQRFDIETLKKNHPTRFERNRNRERHNGLDLVKEGKNFFILGKPGAGKTTFMRHVAMQALDENLDRVPIFITLKDMDGEIMPELVKQFEICGFPDAEPFIHQLLESGKAIVLFDGLDEVNLENNRRADLTKRLSDFSKKFSNCQILITCRIAASDYHFGGFQDVEIADFTPHQVNQVVIKWFEDNEEKKDAFFKDFEREENKGLRELASTPLLLSLLCLAFEDSMTFPRRRADLYEQALDALLNKWDTSRNIQRNEIYRKLSTKLKHRMFAHIAAATFEMGDYFLPQRDLEKQIESYLENLPADDRDKDVDGEQILKAVIAQHGIFVERARRIHAFSHLTFQEYYAAKYIADNTHEGTVKRLIDNYLLDDRWREVFLLTVSQLDRADEFIALFRQAIDSLLKNDVWLIEILQWSEAATRLADSSYTQFSKRSVYLWAVLELTFELALDLARSLDIADARDIDVKGDLDIALDIVHASEHVKEVACDLARTSANVRSKAVAHDLERRQARTHERDLANTLDLDFIHISARMNQLADYLKANQLFIECLKLAYVSNRQEILDGLLLPPATDVGENQNGGKE